MVVGGGGAWVVWVGHRGEGCYPDRIQAECLEERAFVSAADNQTPVSQSVTGGPLSLTRLKSSFVSFVSHTQLKLHALYTGGKGIQAVGLN